MKTFLSHKIFYTTNFCSYLGRSMSFGFLYGFKNRCLIRHGSDEKDK